MPMKPGKGESQSDFVGRCMHDEKSSFPDQKQRLAVCFSMWRDSKKSDTEKAKTFDESKHPRESAGTPEGGRFASEGGGGGEGGTPKEMYQQAVNEVSRAGYKFQSSGLQDTGAWREATTLRHPQGTEPDENVEGKGALLTVGRQADGSIKYSVNYETGFDRPRTGERKFTNVKDAMRYADSLHGVRKDDDMTEYQVTKVDEELGIVFGWGIVSTVDGEPYYDVQDDHIPDESMLKATSEFMEHIRVGRVMHDGDQAGTIVHSMPLTKDIAQAFGIECDRTGWMVGYKPYDKVLLEKFRSGEYTGFSIGGGRVIDEHVE